MIKIKTSYQNEKEKQRVLQPLIELLKKLLKNVKIDKEQTKKGHKNIYINAE